MHYSYSAVSFISPSLFIKFMPSGHLPFQNTVTVLIKVWHFPFKVQSLQVTLKFTLLIRFLRNCFLFMTGNLLEISYSQKCELDTCLLGITREVFVAFLSETSTLRVLYIFVCALWSMYSLLYTKFTVIILKLELLYGIESSFLGLAFGIDAFKSLQCLWLAGEIFQ